MKSKSDSVTARNDCSLILAPSRISGAPDKGLSPASPPRLRDMPPHFQRPPPLWKVKASRAYGT